MIGRILGKYRVVEKLGTGALSDVYRGIQMGLDREVAIKVLPAALAADATMREQFRRASQVTARLSHPNIITVFDSGEQDGLPFTVIEHLRSESLEDRLDREGPLPVPAVLKLAQDLVKALIYAHERGVLHRGLSPACVKFDQRHNAIVTDFARAGGDQGTAQDDLAAVGAILHAALSGGEVGGKLPPLSAELPAEVARFVERARDGAFTGAREMLDALKAIETKHRALRVSRALALPPPPEPEELAPCFDSSGSLGVLASLTSLMSSDDDRREVAQTFGWAVPVMLLTVCCVFWLAY